MKNIKTFRSLWIICLLAIIACFTGCITSYNITTFSNDVEALPYTEITRVNDMGQTVTKKVVEGQFSGKNIEVVMQKAYEEGFTKILSIEYGTKHFLWIISYRWITIRSTKEI